jgi:hypothetical protein
MQYGVVGESRAFRIEARLTESPDRGHATECQGADRLERDQITESTDGACAES